MMPVFNGERFLAEAIDSILAQTFSDFELIIVDDGSRDRSAAIIREYEQRDARIRFFQLERNTGEGPARNYAVDASTGEYVTGLDCDDVCSPNRLEKQVDYLRANPEIGALGVCGMLTDEELNPQDPWDVPEAHAQIAYSMFLGRLPLGASFMFRRDLFYAVGGYEQNRKRSRDIELVFRLLGKTRIANLPDQLYMYRQHGGQPHGPEARRDWHELKRRMLCRLWGEAPQASLERFAQVRRPWATLSWRERRRTKRDINRLIDSMIAANWIEQSDLASLIELRNRQLEKTSPRIWQMFCHWRRRRFGGAGREVEFH